MATIYPDISHYALVQNWAAVQQSCPFLISKATEGTSFVDSTLNSFIAGCESKKIPYWLYAYLRKGNELAQAKFLVSTCKSKVGSYFRGYILDVEAENAAANVKSALDYIAGLGGKCMIYTMYSDYDKYKSIITARPSSCAWWEARYGKNDGTYSSKYPPHSGVDLHQYTDQGTCSGIRGDVDLNRLTGTKKESWFTSAASVSKAGDTIATTATAPIRRRNSADSSHEGDLLKGATLPVVDETPNWYLCSAYIPKKSCAVSGNKARVQKVCNIRASNSKDSTKLGTMYKNALLPATATTENWIQVTFYVAKRLCK